MNIRDEMIDAIVNSKGNVDLSAHRVVVFGAGNTAVLYQNSFARLGIEPDFYADNDKNKQGSIRFNKKVISFEELIELSKRAGEKPVFVLICSRMIKAIKAIEEQLSAFAFQYANVDEYVFYHHLDDILKVFDLLEDVFSKETYARVIIGRTTAKELPDKIIRVFLGFGRICRRYFRKIYLA